MIESLATIEQKAAGFDLADYLIERQREINQSNELIDSYNAKLEKVLMDKSLNLQFNVKVERQKSELIVNRKLSESEFERVVSEAEAAYNENPDVKIEVFPKLDFTKDSCNGCGKAFSKKDVEMNKKVEQIYR